jgi:hypothetical protein
MLASVGPFSILKNLKILKSYFLGIGWNGEKNPVRAHSTDQKHSRLNRSDKIYTKQHVHPHLATYLQNIFEFEKHVFIHQLVIISVAQHRENYDIIRQRERFLKSNLMRKPFFAQ